MLLTQLFAIWLLILMYGLVFYTRPWLTPPPARRARPSFNDTNLTIKRAFNATAR